MTFEKLKTTAFIVLALALISINTHAEEVLNPPGTASNENVIPVLVFTEGDSNRRHISNKELNYGRAVRQSISRYTGAATEGFDNYPLTLPEPETRLDKSFYRMIDAIHESDAFEASVVDQGGTVVVTLTAQRPRQNEASLEVLANYSVCREGVPCATLEPAPTPILKVKIASEAPNETQVVNITLGALDPREVELPIISMGSTMRIVITFSDQTTSDRWKFSHKITNAPISEEPPLHPTGTPEVASGTYYLSWHPEHPGTRSSGCLNPGGDCLYARAEVRYDAENKTATLVFVSTDPQNPSAEYYFDNVTVLPIGQHPTGNDGAEEIGVNLDYGIVFAGILTGILEFGGGVGH